MGRLLRLLMVRSRLIMLVASHLRLLRLISSCLNPLLSHGHFLQPSLPNFSHFSLFKCIIDNRLRNFHYLPPTANLMYCKLLQHNMLLTLRALVGPGSTGDNMPIIFPNCYVQLAELTVLGPRLATVLMPHQVVLLELHLTELTRRQDVELQVVLLLIIDINHHLTLPTSLDVPAAVAEVAVDLALREQLGAVVAPLLWLDGLHERSEIITTIAGWYFIRQMAMVFAIMNKEVRAGVLSTPIDVRFFEERKVEEQFSLVKYFWGPSETPRSNLVSHNVNIHQLNDRYSIAFRDKELELFTVQEKEEHTQLVRTWCQSMCLNHPVAFVCCNKAHPCPVLMVVVATETEILLLRLDTKEKKLWHKSTSSISDVRAIHFGNATTVFAVAEGNYLVEFDCSNQKLTKKTSHQFRMHDPEEYGKFVKGFLFGSLLKPPDSSKLYYLYTTSKVTHSQQTLQTLFIKQFQKLPTQILQDEVFPIKGREIKKFTSLSSCGIFHHMNSFVMALEDEIVVIQKRYQEYLLIDNIRRKSEQVRMMFFQRGLVCFVSPRLIEMHQLKVEETRCNLEIINILVCEIEPQYPLKEVHIEEHNVIFYFANLNDQSRQKIACLTREEPIKKLLSLAKAGVDNSLIWKLSHKFGIHKKDFYFQQWLQSPKAMSDIANFLFETKDVFLIKTELKLAFRRTSFPINEIINIYHKFLAMIEAKLTEQLSVRLIKLYLKCHFLIRKLKVQPEGTIEFGEFMKITKRSVITYLEELSGHYRNMQLVSTHLKEKERGGRGIKYDIVMKNILGEFQLILLERYEEDLVHLIRPFALDLEYFFEKFPFYLPNYPYHFEFRPKVHLHLEDQHVSTQNRLFLPINESAFDEEITLEFLRRELEKHHPTSQVDDTLQQLTSDQKFMDKRLVSHGLMMSSKMEYMEKGKRLSGLHLYLVVCEFCNRENFANESGYVDLCHIFASRNGLQGEDLLRCSFFSRLHWLILSHDVTRSFTIKMLVEMSEEDLLALFFLGNKDKIYLILNQLKGLYEEFPDSQGVSHFNVTLSKFIRSDVCSPVEVRQLLLEILDKGHSFQQTHQDLINIIVDGYSFRTQIRQEDRTQEMKEILMQIRMDNLLNERVIKILTISGMKELFKSFKCERLTLLEVESEGLEILDLVLQNYFQDPSIQTDILLEGTQIYITNPRNMLNILLYIQSKLYPDIEEAEVLVLFGDKLVKYEMFEVAQELLDDKEVFHTLNMYPEEYAEALIKSAFEKIYKSQDTGTFEEVKPYIKNILKLHLHKSAFIQQEEARINLGEVVSECGFEITPYQLFYIEKKEHFVLQLIESGYDSLTLDMLFEINECFKVINNERRQEYDADFLTWVALYTKLLIKNYNSEQAQDSICYLLHNNCFIQLYNIVTEAMFQAVSLRYPEETVISRSMVEFYTASGFNTDAVTAMFETNFSVDSILRYDDKGERLEVHDSYFYLQLKPIDVRLEQVQQVARRVSKSTSDFYRYYYFAITILSCPDRGFLLNDIDYNPQVLLEVIQQLGNSLLNNQDHLAIGTNFNYFHMKRSFLIGLMKYSCDVMDIDEIKGECFDQFGVDGVLDAMFLEMKKQGLGKVLGVAKRCFVYLQQNDKANKSKLARSKKYRMSMEESINSISAKKKSSSNKEDMKLTMKSFHHNPYANKTLTLEEFMRDLQNLSTSHPGLPQRRVMELVWDNTPINATRGEEDTKKFSLNLFPISLGNDNETDEATFVDHNYYTRIFEECRTQEIKALDKEEMLKHLKEYYNTAKIGTFAKLLDVAGLGEERNIKMVQSAVRFESNFDMKQLFSFEFFFYNPTTDSQLSKQDSDKAYTQVIFEYLAPTLRQIINENNWYISKIVCTFLRFEKIYEYKVILFAVEKMLRQPGYDLSSLEEHLPPMLQKLPLSFLSQYFLLLLGLCKSKESKKMLLSLLEPFFQKSGRGHERLSPEETQRISIVKERIDLLLREE